MTAVSGRNVLVRGLEMQAETLVGIHVKCLFVVVVVVVVFCFRHPILIKY